jgi:hypothetical protein
LPETAQRDDPGLATTRNPGNVGQITQGTSGVDSYLN